MAGVNAFYGTFAVFFSGVWRVWSCLALQTRGINLAFGGFVVVWRSKRGESISRLEGLGLFGDPNVGNQSRVWRVWSVVLLQTRGNSPAFVVAQLLTLMYIVVQ
ncbi:hypothetical protein CJI57_01085 [Bifidobacteriaceae bacterium WP012]|nr:hypothetical protein CJI57_01085 [Bifidobacteriaceae bacterium WP012]